MAEKPTSIITDEMKTLAASLSAHTQHSSRIWSYATTITVIVILADASTQLSTLEPVPLFGLRVSLKAFYPVACVFLASLSIAFCAAELQGQRTARILRDYLQGVSGKGTKSFTIDDVAHSLYINAYNRIYPFNHFLKPKIRRIAYAVIKIPTDVVYYATPLFGCWFALYQTFHISGWNPWSLYSIGLEILALVSLFTTLIIIWASFRWIVEVLLDLNKGVEK